MELPEDCLNLIKEFAGPVHTSLDIMNCYRMLRTSTNPNINKYMRDHFSVKKVQYLLELLPYLVKKSKNVIGYDRKCHIRDHIEHTYVVRLEIIVAMTLMGYPMLQNGFQADFITEVQITRGLKKMFKFKYPAYKTESTREYLPLLSYVVWNKTPFLKRSSNFEKVTDNKNKRLKELNYHWCGNNTCACVV